MKIDPTTKLAFSLYENPGVHAVLLGSGISRAAAIPTGWEITLDLVRRVALMQGEPEQPDWARWYATKFGGEPNYSRLLEQLADTAAERRAILDRYIEPTPEERDAGKKLPTRAHRAIARLVRDGFIKVILTTNFDRLMENALRDEGVEPVVVASVDGLAGSVPMSHAGSYLVKLHGEYKDARILNTDAELAGYPPEYDQLLDRVFDDYGLIVCGWSGEWDHALRAAILRSPKPPVPALLGGKGRTASAPRPGVAGSSAGRHDSDRRCRWLPGRRAALGGNIGAEPVAGSGQRRVGRGKCAALRGQVGVPYPIGRSGARPARESSRRTG